MTPHFTTPCYVRVDDKDKRKEIIEILTAMRGTPACISKDIHNPILCDTDYWLDFNMSNTNPKYLLDYIDCGTNIELFLALAGMRSDTGINQYFIIRDSFVNYDRCNEKEQDRIREGWARYATAAEIIEHFNEK